MGLASWSHSSRNPDPPISHPHPLISHDRPLTILTGPPVADTSSECEYMCMCIYTVMCISYTCGGNFSYGTKFYPEKRSCYLIFFNTGKCAVCLCIQSHYNSCILIYTYYHVLYSCHESTACTCACA